MNLWWSETAGQNFLGGGEIISPVGEGFIPSASGENPFAPHPTLPPPPPPIPLVRSQNT